MMVDWVISMMNLRSLPFSVYVCDDWWARCAKQKLADSHRRAVGIATTSRVFTDLLSNSLKRSLRFSPGYEGTENVFYFLSEQKFVYTCIFARVFTNLSFSRQKGPNLNYNAGKMAWILDPELPCDQACHRVHATTERYKGIQPVYMWEVEPLARFNLGSGWTSRHTKSCCCLHEEV